MSSLIHFLYNFCCMNAFRNILYFKVFYVFFSTFMHVLQFLLLFFLNKILHIISLTGNIQINCSTIKKRYIYNVFTFFLVFFKKSVYNYYILETIMMEIYISIYSTIKNTIMHRIIPIQSTQTTVTRLSNMWRDHF